MNFFPGLYQPKSTKKYSSFSNHLTGLNYNNKQFINNTKNLLQKQTPRSLSHFEKANINIGFNQTYLQKNKQIENGQNINNKIQRKRKNIYLKKQERKRIQREIVAINATARLAEPVYINNQLRSKILLNKKCNKYFNDLHNTQLVKMFNNNSKTFSSSKNYHKNLNLSNNFNDNKQNNKHKRCQSSQLFGKPLNEARNQFSMYKNLNISQANNNINIGMNKASYSFENIQILLLDIIQQLNDLKKSIITINLQKYFRSFFKKQLSGHLTLQFILKVQQYISHLFQENKIDQKIDPLLVSKQKEIFSLVSRLAFLNKINQLQQRKTKINQQKIHAMIRYYCIPQKDYRQSSLRDILLMLSLEVFQKFNCSRHDQFVLLDEDGNQITDILQIRFTARKLFLTTRKNIINNYHKYTKIVDDFNHQGKKLTFNQSIKHSFRRNIAKGNIDQTHFNYSENYQIQNIKRKFQLNNAQQLLRKRNQTYRINKFAPKDQMIYFDRPISERSKQKLKQKLNQNQNQQVYNKIYNENQNKSLEAQPSQFWRIENVRIKSPQPSTLRPSLSPRHKRQHSQNKSTTQQQKSRLHQYLLQNQNNQLNSQILKKIQQEFKQLVGENDIFDLKFNHDIKNRIKYQTLKEYFIFFKGKTIEQMERILTAIKLVTQKYNKIHSKSSSLDSYFLQQQYQSQHQNDKYLQSISWNDYKNLRITIQCLQPKQILMQFISNYLHFNQYGQLSKQILYTQLQFILYPNNQKSIIQVIIEVIWSWFQTNSIIQSSVIRKNILESWYEKYKIVYCMLTSLIFGTNHTTALDLAYEVLVNEK